MSFLLLLAWDYLEYSPAQLTISYTYWAFYQFAASCIIYPGMTAIIGTHIQDVILRDYEHDHHHRSKWPTQLCGRYRMLPQM